MPMTNARASWTARLVATLVVTLAALHCGGGDNAPAAPPAGDGGALEAALDTGVDAPADAASSPWGFDQRPPNPTCLAPKRPRPADGAGVKLVRVYPNVQTITPVALAKRPGVAKWYVVEQKGRIVSFDDNPAATAPSVVLDLLAKVDTQGTESGMLGLTFHPKFAQNGYAYVYYAHDGMTPTEGVRVSRFTSPDGGVTLDPATEKVILEIRRPIQNHLGGNVLFGPDGYLYVGLGDSTVSSAVQTLAGPCNATECTVFNGKMLRIDVDGGDPYAIPPGNPFASGVGGRPELFAWGFRNPWRWSFDRASGDLWLADVGESSREEIDIVKAGGNYGWPLSEGTLCDTCLPQAIPPIYEIAHPDSHSITGGFVYRGSRIPQLQGAYVFGDFVLNKIWALVTDPLTGARTRLTLEPDGPPIYSSAFGETDDGEIIAAEWGSGTFWQLVPSAPVTGADPFPQKLSLTGCVNPKEPTKPASGVIPYAVNVPFWSDGAEKERWFAVPDGKTIAVKEGGDLELPVGSVTMKTFRLGGKPVETRLFVRHDDGDWGGYSFEWNDAGTDATLLPDAKVKRVGTQSWTFPSRSDCMRCHTTAAGRTLGLEAAQLERTADYPGRPGRDQLDTLTHAGLFTVPPPRGAALPALDGAATTESRARAYLHVSCSGCHRPGGGSGTAMDLRFTTPLAATKTCNVVPERGSMAIADARLLAPGEPTRSLLVRRPQALDVWRMPPLASRVVDTQGTALLGAWIGTVSFACP